jgi:hypothetical protein
MQKSPIHAGLRRFILWVNPCLFNAKRALLFVACALGGGLLQAQPVPTSVQQTPSGGWQLVRGGQPYYVNGAGGSVHMDQIVALGGNSLRTWGLEDAERILDEAQKHGLTVMMGLWL